jgi:hypothetical protein
MTETTCTGERELWKRKHWPRIEAVLKPTLAAVFFLSIALASPWPVLIYPLICGLATALFKPEESAAAKRFRAACEKHDRRVAAAEQSLRQAAINYMGGNSNT